ncbi:MAG: MFS transporter, partial [Gammaproteobacteria bacterium]
MPVSVWVLMLAQALSMSVAPLLMFSGGLVGSDLAPEPGWATLPLALSVIGTALGVMPLTRLMQSIGRKWVFVAGTILAGLTALLAAYSVGIGSFALFCLASLLSGGSLAVAQQYRFAAMETVSVDKAGRAASQVLLGGLMAAYLGPELVVFGQGIGEQLSPATLRGDHIPFIGAFVLLSFICLLAMLVILLGYRNPVKQDIATSKAGRPLTEIF